MSLSNGSSRVVRLGSCGCVQQFATIAKGSLSPFRPVQIPGGDRDHERVVVGPEEDLQHRSGRGRAIPIVVERELHPAEDACVVQRHLTVLVPTLDDAPIHAREVDLPELLEVRVVGAQHVVDRAALVRDPPQRYHLDSVDRSA